MIATVDRDALLPLLRELRAELGAAACSVALLDGEELIFVAADGSGAAEVTGLRLPLTRGLAGFVVASGQAIAVADVHADHRFDRASAEQTGYVPTSILAVPIEVDEDDEVPVGVVEVLDRTPTPTDLAVAADAAVRIGALVRRPAGGGDDLAELVAAFADRSTEERRRAADLLRDVLAGRR